MLSIPTVAKRRPRILTEEEILPPSATLWRLKRRYFTPSAVLGAP
jgi:hypothetical protein